MAQLTAFELHHVKGTCKPFIPNSTKNKAVTRQGHFLKRIFQSWAILIRFSVAPWGQACSNVFVDKPAINSLLRSFASTVETVSTLRILYLLLDDSTLVYSLMFLNMFIFVRGQLVKFSKPYLVSFLTQFIWIMRETQYLFFLKQGSNPTLFYTIYETSLLAFQISQNLVVTQELLLKSENLVLRNSNTPLNVWLKLCFQFLPFWRP